MSKPQPLRNLTHIQRELRRKGNSRKAKVLQSFFKTGPGQYAEGDIFLGVPAGVLRRLAKFYVGASQSTIIGLLRSKVHEERFLALLLLLHHYRNAKPAIKNKFFRIYLDNIQWVNNWDLVDISAPHIIGAHLMNNKSKHLLYQLAASTSFWQRRIAIIATLAFIKNNRFSDTFKIAQILFTDKHDLIHKAVGWMLREVGKRDRKALEQFLKRHCIHMPRTMLRYAIERFPERLRQTYLRLKTASIW